MGLTITLFGKMELRDTTHHPPPQLDARGKALLAYLLLQQRPTTRDELLEALWQDDSSHGAHHRLNTSLWRLRRALSDHPEIVLQSRSTCSCALSPESEVSVDTLDFERLTRPIFSRSNRAPETLAQFELDALERAVALYRGELLDEIFSEWVLPARRRYQNTYLTCLAMLSRHYRHSGLCQRAIELCEARLNRDPVCEEAHLELMEIYWSEGRRTCALQQYRDCCDVLERELGVKPNNAVRRLAQQLTRVADPDGAMEELQPSSLACDPRAIQVALDRLGRGLKEMSEAYASLRKTLGTCPSDLTAQRYSVSRDIEPG
jgi:DNA-binding SARP family transcriptional activator